MTTPQHPLGSGFGATSTTSEVLEGMDLTGKRAIVTGGYSGIGYATTRALSEAGARVLVPARRENVARDALADIANVEVLPMDLANLTSVAAFADAVIASGERVDMILANAAVMAPPLTRVGPGWEVQFATNHIGHFALVARLWGTLADDARVVATTSGAHRITGMRWDGLHFADGYERWQAYGQSKTANVLFAGELDRRGARRGIRAFAADPGVIKTPLQRHFTDAEQIELGWMDADGNPNPSFKSPEQGAATQVWAATARSLAGKGGVYCSDCDVTSADRVAPWATDAEQAARLWTLSVELTGVDAIPEA